MQKGASMSFLFGEQLKKEMSNNVDFVTRPIVANCGKVWLYFLKSMTDKNAIADEIIEPIVRFGEKLTFEKLQGLIFSADVKEIKKEEVLENILKNFVVIEFDEQFLCVDLEKYPMRTPTEPPTSPNIYGPREGFVEALVVNLSLIRKRLPTKNLVIENMNVGRETHTKICLLYLKNIANKKVVKQIKNKIKKIDIDGVVDSYYIAEFLKLRPHSMFEQSGFQEKPDVVVAKMLEGRVAILVDGSPIVISLPYMIFEDLQSSNDYYTNYIYVNMIRVIRTIGIIFATIMPGLYLSIRLYSYSALPLNYVIIIANATKNLPFTPVVEIILILLLFQILYEVSLRLPQYLGLATSIVGALVLGDTGVKAGLISPPGVIVVAVSIMAIYTIPSMASQLTVLRAVFVVLGATLGLFGIIGGMVYVINYINSLNAYDTPFLAPFAPKIQSDLQDGLFKKPLIDMRKRPKSLGSKNSHRQGKGGKV